MADIFSVIADSTRRDILSVLLERRATTGDASVSQIVDALGVPQPTVSKHLRTLRDAGLVTVREDGRNLLDEADFEVRAGEILGIVGVSGNGQATLGRVLSGLARPSSGRLTLTDGHGKTEDLGRMTPAQTVRAGVGRIPEDRHAQGVVGEMTMW